MSSVIGGGDNWGIWDAANARTLVRKGTPTFRIKAPYLLSGKVESAQCGFHFQEQSTRTKNRDYSRYFCAGFNAKRVRDYAAIGRDDLEAFVVESVRETLCDPLVIATSEQKVQELIHGIPKTVGRDKERFEELFRDNAAKQSRVMAAIEQGAPMEASMERLEMLVKEQRDLQQRLDSALQQSQKAIDLDNTAALVRSFLGGLNDMLLEAPFEERKDLIKRCVGKIVVDGKNRMAHCFVRCVLVVDQATAVVYDQMEKTKKASDKSPFRTAVVAGTRSFLHLQPLNVLWKSKSGSSGGKDRLPVLGARPCPSQVKNLIITSC